MASSLTRAVAVVAVAALVSSGASIPLSAQRARGPVVRDLSAELACSPQASVQVPTPPIRVLGGQQPRRTVFGAPDVIIVSGGSALGMRIGQEYFIRRVVLDEFALPVSGLVPVNIHTAGWLRIVDVAATMAVATITYSCDGVLEGDYLEPYVRPVVPIAGVPGEPDFGAPGMIVLGDERRQMGAAGSTMVLDRGIDHGVRPGQRGTIFRNALEGAGPIVRIGEATAVLVRQDTSVIRIESSRDAVMVGDRVALHK